MSSDNSSQSMLNNNNPGSPRTTEITANLQRPLPESLQSLVRRRSSDSNLEIEEPIPKRRRRIDSSDVSHVGSGFLSPGQSSPALSESSSRSITLPSLRRSPLAFDELGGIDAFNFVPHVGEVAVAPWVAMHLAASEPETMELQPEATSVGAPLSTFTAMPRPNKRRTWPRKLTNVMSRVAFRWPGRASTL